MSADLAKRPSSATPKGLKSSGRKLWRSIVSIYDLRVDEHRVLLEACRTVDLVDDLVAQVAADGLMIEGSTGQQRLHPAVTELQRNRDLVARLLKRLDLPEPDDAKAQQRSKRARKAVGARWGRRDQIEEVRRGEAAQ